MTAIGFNWAFLFDDKFVDVSDIADGDRQEARRLVRHRPRSRRGQRQVEGHAVRQHRPADELAHRLVQARPASTSSPTPGTSSSRPGIKLKKKGHPFGFELGHGFGDNHGWLYPLLWSYGGREVESRRQDRRHRFRRDRAGRRLLPPVLQGDDARGLPGLDRRQQQQGVPGRADLLHQQRRVASWWSAKRDFPEIAKVTDQALNPQGTQGPLPHAEPAVATRSSTHTKDQEAAKDFLRWLMLDDKQLGALARHRPTPTTSRSCTPTTTRRCGTSSRATCPTASRSRPRSCRAGRRRQPGAVGERGEVRRRRHVRQGLRRHIDQGGHRRRGGAAEADLQERSSA